jgi:shikimate kinase
MNQSPKVKRPNIYLIGFMGVGKTAVGRALARSLKMEFIDSDSAIEKTAGKAITDIFADEGEPAFRQMEREFIESGHGDEGTVVSCGGGLPLQPGMQELLKGKGVVICLFARSETIIARTIGNPKRPLLNVDNPEEQVRKLMAQREPVYMATGIGISTEKRSIHEVVRNITRIYSIECRRGKV